MPQLQPQLENPYKIKEFFKEITFEHKLKDEEQVEILLIHMPFQQEEIDYNELLELIKHEILTNFALRHSEIQKKIRLLEGKAKEKLLKKSIRRLSQHTAKGELGELILFTLLDVYFNAPKILTKISTKTSRTMPVFGADAVHAQFINDQLTLYLGESKLHRNFKSAATKTALSITSALSKYEEEFDLLDSFIDFPNLNEDLEQQIINLLNPFPDDDTPLPDNKNLNDIIRSPCFIGFSKPDLFTEASDEQEFTEAYVNLAKDYIDNFFTKVDKRGLEAEKVALLMLPFSCVNNFVEAFINYFEIQK